MKSQTDSAISQMIRRKRFFDSSEYWMNTKRQNRSLFWQSILKPFIVIFLALFLGCFVIFLFSFPSGQTMTREEWFGIMSAMTPYLFLLPLIMMITWDEAFSKLHSGRWIVTTGGMIFRESKDQRIFLPWCRIHRVDFHRNRLVFDARQEQLVMKIKQNGTKNWQLIWFLNSLITMMQKRNIRTDSVVTLRNTLIRKSIPVMSSMAAMIFPILLTLFSIGIVLFFMPWFSNLLNGFSEFMILRELLINVGIVLVSGVVVLILAYIVGSREFIAVVQRKHYRELVESFRSLSPNTFRYNRKGEELPAELTSHSIEEIFQRQQERREELVQQFNTLPRRFDWTCYFHLMVGSRLVSFTFLFLLGILIIGHCCIYFQWGSKSPQPLQWNQLFLTVAVITWVFTLIGLVERETFRKILLHGKATAVTGVSIGSVRNSEYRSRNTSRIIRSITTSESGESQWNTASIIGTINGPRNRIRDNGCIVFYEEPKMGTDEKPRSKFKRRLPYALIYYDQSESMIYKQGKWTLSGYERLEAAFHLIAWISGLTLLSTLILCI